MKDRRKALKVKIKSLAAEAKIIRLEERRALGRRVVRPEPDGLVVEYRGRDQALYYELRAHRLIEVRREARAAMLAYACIRGVPLAAVESKVDGDEPLAERVARLGRVIKVVHKFGPLGHQSQCAADRVAAWVAASGRRAI